MPKLRRLSGREVVKIRESFGFEVDRIRGSHHLMRRVVTVLDEEGQATAQRQTLNVPVHGRKEIPLGTLKAIYRDACAFMPEDELEPYFYTE